MPYRASLRFGRRKVLKYFVIAGGLLFLIQVYFPVKLKCLDERLLGSIEERLKKHGDAYVRAVFVRRSQARGKSYSSKALGNDLRKNEENQVPNENNMSVFNAKKKFVDFEKLHLNSADESHNINWTARDSKTLIHLAKAHLESNLNVSDSVVNTSRLLSMHLANLNTIKGGNSALVIEANVEKMLRELFMDTVTSNKELIATSDFVSREDDDHLHSSALSVGNAHRQDTKLNSTLQIRNFNHSTKVPSKKNSFLTKVRNTTTTIIPGLDDSHNTYLLNKTMSPVSKSDISSLLPQSKELKQLLNRSSGDLKSVEPSNPESLLVSRGGPYSERRFFVSDDSQFEYVTFLSNSEFSPKSRNHFEVGHFTDEDKKMIGILLQADIREVYQVKGHSHVKVVSLDCFSSKFSQKEVPLEACANCGVIKAEDDLLEVLAFHLDRVLGINRVVPTIARKFSLEEIRLLHLDGEDAIFPVMHFTPNLIHSGSFQADQNSFEMSWRRYQDILTGCYGNNDGELCPVVDYEEWGRMAVLDFLLQNHDRLDRYCCGYTEDEGEDCFFNEIRDDLDNCEDWDNRFLVHIMTSSDDPRRLVLIDNMFHYQRSSDNLNYEILKGIRKIPDTVMRNIELSDLHMRLMDSLRHDKSFWSAVRKGYNN